MRGGVTLGQLRADDNKIHSFGGLCRQFVFLLSNGKKPGSRCLLLLVYQVEEATFISLRFFGSFLYWPQVTLRVLIVIAKLA